MATRKWATLLAIVIGVFFEANTAMAQARVITLTENESVQFQLDDRTVACSFYYQTDFEDRDGPAVNLVETHAIHCTRSLDRLEVNIVTERVDGFLGYVFSSVPYFLQHAKQELRFGPFEQNPEATILSSGERISFQLPDGTVTILCEAFQQSMYCNAPPTSEAIFIGPSLIAIREDAGIFRDAMRSGQTVSGVPTLFITDRGFVDVSQTALSFESTRFQIAEGVSLSIVPTVGYAPSMFLVEFWLNDVLARGWVERANGTFETGTFVPPQPVTEPAIRTSDERSRRDGQDVCIENWFSEDCYLVLKHTFEVFTDEENRELLYILIGIAIFFLLILFLYKVVLRRNLTRTAQVSRLATGIAESSREILSQDVGSSPLVGNDNHVPLNEKKLPLHIILLQFAFFLPAAALFYQGFFAPEDQQIYILGGDGPAWQIYMALGGFLIFVGAIIPKTYKAMRFAKEFQWEVEGDDEIIWRSPIWTTAVCVTNKNLYCWLTSTPEEIFDGRLDDMPDNMPRQYKTTIPLDKIVSVEWVKVPLEENWDGKKLKYKCPQLLLRDGTTVQLLNPQKKAGWGKIYRGFLRALDLK